MYYAGRVHVVHPVARTAGLCGLPVEDVWEVRPPLPEHLCPDCCVRAMAASYPSFATASTRPRAHSAGSGDTEWFGPAVPNQIRAAQVSYTDEKVTM
jgi:hypothetical protein